jgi:hypothetical protein
MPIGGVFPCRHGIPEGFPICPLCRRHIRQKELLPDKALLPSVVMLNAIIVVVHPGTAHVGRRRDSGTACPPADNLCFQMINCQFLFPPSFVSRPSSNVPRKQ